MPQVGLKMKELKMKLNEFEKLPTNKREEIIIQGSTNVMFVKGVKFALLLAFVGFVSGKFLQPYYAIWSAEMEAKAEIAKESVLKRCNK